MPVRAKFILNYRGASTFECYDRDRSCRIEISGNKVVRFLDGSSISRAEAVAAVNAYQQDDWAKFLEWLDRKGFALSEFPEIQPPVCIA